MSDVLGHEAVWYPFARWGLTSPFFAIHTHTVFYTWITMALLIILIVIARYILSTQNHSVSTVIIKSISKNFIDLVSQSVGRLIYRYYLFIGSLFLFILGCNWIALIPICEEPTKDLNTTLALGIISFGFVQKEIIKAHGLLAYIKEYFMPFSFIFPLNLIAGICVLPLKLLGEFASIVSISFRLFGNIFGGSIISLLTQRLVSGSILLNLATLLSGLNIIVTGFFIIFEGFLQAFVFAILTLTNIVMALQAQEPENKDVEPFELV